MGLGNLAILARLASQASGMGNAYELGKQSEEDRQYQLLQRQRLEEERLLGNRMKQEELGLKKRQVTAEEQRLGLVRDEAMQKKTLGEFAIKKAQDERDAADLKKWRKSEMKPTGLPGVNLYDRGDAEGNLETIVVDNEGNQLPIDANTAMRAAKIHDSLGEELSPEDEGAADLLIKSGVATPKTRAKIHSTFGWLSIPENERAALYKDAESQYEKDFKPLMDNYELYSRLLTQYETALSRKKEDPMADVMAGLGDKKPKTLQEQSALEDSLLKLRSAMEKAGTTVADFKRDQAKVKNAYMAQAFNVKYAPMSGVMGNKPVDEPTPGPHTQTIGVPIEEAGNALVLPVAPENSTKKEILQAKFRQLQTKAKAQGFLSKEDALEQRKVREELEARTTGHLRFED